jgi:hypothetical protein
VNNQSREIAILFFSRSAAAEAAQKQFVSYNYSSDDEKIADSLIRHTCRQIKSTGFPFFWIDEHQQVGDTFGKRFAHAFRQLFDRGYDYVISVGNDSPLLKTQHILEAAGQLRSGDADIVLGPDNDGGTWLMGYSRKAFTTTDFRELPWNTNRLLKTILDRQASQLNIALLETLSDIDGAEALKIFSKSKFADQTLLRLIRRLCSLLVSAFVHENNESLLFPGVPTFRANLLRAPPLG